MYRFLLRPAWIAGAMLAVAAAVVMVFLGRWQLHRYAERSAINHRIDSADSVAAVPLTSVLTRPSAPGSAGPAPGRDAAWTKITVTGRYDVTHEIQARARTVNGDVGFEIVTPLVLTDGTAVLVDRGWIPAAEGGAQAAPTVPPASPGTVTVVGQIHLSESRPTPIAHRDGRLDTRRISVPPLAHEMPYPTYGAYVLLTQQTPPASPDFVAVPIDHEDAWQNAGYTVQWWLFAAMALFAFVWQVRKEAEARSESDVDPSSTWPSSIGPSSAEPGSAGPRSVDPSAVDPSSAEPSSAGPSSVAPGSVAPGSAGPGSVGRPGSPGRSAPPGSASAAVPSSSGSRLSRSRRSSPRPKPTGDRVEEADRRAAERAAREAAAKPPDVPTARTPD